MNLLHLTILLAYATLALTLRGGGFHNYLVGEAEMVLREMGFETAREHPETLPGGGKNFVDLLARREGLTVCIEAETTARNVLSNAIKADQIGCPLIVLVPNAKVRKAVVRKLSSGELRPGGCPICILFLGQLKQWVMNYLHLNAPANGDGENRKSNQSNQQEGW